MPEGGEGIQPTQPVSETPSNVIDMGDALLAKEKRPSQLGASATVLAQSANPEAFKANVDVHAEELKKAYGPSQAINEQFPPKVTEAPVSPKPNILSRIPILKNFIKP